MLLPASLESWNVCPPSLQLHLMLWCSVQNPVASVRYVAISATIYNIQDIAEWLDVPRQGIFAFGEEVRPVKLTTVVKGFPMTKTDFLFERRLNDHLGGLIQQYSKGRPTLVFCRCTPLPAWLLTGHMPLGSWVEIFELCCTGLSMAN